MLSILKNLKLIRESSEVTKFRLFIQFIIIFTVPFFEASCVFFLIPFLELFSQSAIIESSQRSLPYELLAAFFKMVNIQFNLFTTGIFLCVLIVFKEISSVISSIMLQSTMAKIEFGAQNLIVKSFLKASFLSNMNLGEGKFMELCNTCSKETARVFQGVIQIASISITMLSYLMVLIVTSPMIALVALLLTILSVLFLNFTVRDVKKVGESIVKDRSNLTQKFHGIFSQIREIKVNNNYKQIIEDVKKQTLRLFELTVKTFTIGIFHRSFLTTILIIISIFLIIYLKQIKVLELVVLTAGLAMMLRLLPLVSNFTHIRQGYAARLPFLIDLHNHIQKFHGDKEIDNGKQLFHGLKDNIQFQNVSFSYSLPSNNVLKNINLRIKVGTSVSIVGMSGAGKSTMIDSLARLIDITNGSILFDGKPISAFTLHTLRNNISYLPQTSKIFDGSIRYNISMSDSPKNDKYIEEIIKSVGLDDFVKNLKLGLETVIGDIGTNLSGGQTQRIAIARALFKEAKILIFDEPTSSLDPKNTEKISELIKNLQLNRKVTIFVISHNWKTVSKLDKMLKLEEGRIVYFGKPKKSFMDRNIIKK